MLIINIELYFDVIQNQIKLHLLTHFSVIYYTPLQENAFQYSATNLQVIKNVLRQMYVGREEGNLNFLRARCNEISTT